MKIVKDLLASKKFIGALLTMIAAAAVAFGVPEITVGEILVIVSPMLTYIGAQGIADMGKESAKVLSGPVNNNPDF